MKSLSKVISYLNSKAVNILINAGANPSVRDVNGMTPCHLAAFKGHYASCYYLLSIDRSNEPMRDLQGNTLLMTLCSATPSKIYLFYMEKILNILALRSQLCLSTQDKNGDTSLHLATRNGNALIVRALLILGANSKVANFSGETPASIASFHRDSRLLVPLFPPSSVPPPPPLAKNPTSESSNVSSSLRKLSDPPALSSIAANAPAPEATRSRSSTMPSPDQVC